jgi:hypothetical protein
MDPIAAPVAVSTEPPVRSVRSVILSGKLTQAILATQGPCAFPCFDPRCSLTPLLLWSPRSRMPRGSLDAPEDLPKQAVRQVALGQLEDKVAGMPDQAPGGLKEPLLEARQVPPLNGQGEDQSAQEIAEVIGDDPAE